MQTSTV
jgi:hypothetical protein